MTARIALGLLCGTVAALIWGGGAVVSRHLVTQSIDPRDLALFRYAGAFPLALATVLVFGRRAHLDIEWRRLAVLLGLAGPPYQLLLIAGYGHATAGAGTLLVAGLLPVFSLLIPLLSATGGPDKRAAAGTVLAVTGLLVFAGAAGAPSLDDVGLFLFSIAAMLWAVLNHLVRTWHVDPLRLTVALALWSPLFLPAYLLLRPGGMPAVPLRDVALQLVYHGWLVAFAATLLFFLAVRLAGLLTSSVLQALAPCIAGGFGAALLAEPLGARHLAGIAITTVGVILAAIGPSITVGRNAR